MLELDALREAFPEVGAFRTALVAGLADAGYAPNEYGLNDVLLHTAIALDRVAANHPLDDRRRRRRRRRRGAGRRPADPLHGWDRSRRPGRAARRPGRTARDRDVRHDDRARRPRGILPGCSRRGRRPAPPRRRTRTPAGLAYLAAKCRWCAASSAVRHPRTSSTSTTTTSSTGSRCTSTTWSPARATRRLPAQSADGVDQGRLSADLRARRLHRERAGPHRGHPRERRRDRLHRDARRGVPRPPPVPGEAVRVAVSAPAYHDVHTTLAERIRAAVDDDVEVVVAGRRRSRTAADLLVAVLEPAVPVERLVVVAPFPTGGRPRARARRDRRAFAAHGGGRGSPPALSSYIAPELFVRGLRGLDRDGAIRMLGDRMITVGVIDRAYVEGALERERLSSTAFTEHLAVPHAMTMTARRTAIAIAVDDVPIDWARRERQRRRADRVRRERAGGVPGGLRPVRRGLLGARERAAPGAGRRGLPRAARRARAAHGAARRVGCGPLMLGARANPGRSILRVAVGSGHPRS